MIKRTITFKDLDGEPVTEDFYFALSTVELAEMGFGDDGLANRIQKIIATENTAEIFQMFKLILTKAIGKRSDDNRRFVKNQDIIDEFFQSNAYEELFLEWIADGSKAAAFINGIMPSNLDETVKKIGDAQAKNGQVETQQQELPAWYTEGRVPTEAEIVGAPPALLAEAFKRKNASGN